MATALRPLNPTADADADALEAMIAARAAAPLLRLLTCGSVDDGKSTLIGRLLYDAGGLADDQIAALHGDSLRSGQAPGSQEAGALDFASLVDGLDAEREQGITIDVAYRFFSTPRRKFIIADTPGHERYTRNMVTGASNADLAIILVDATKGVLTQTRRHSFLVHLLGIRHIVLAVNKMDLVGFDQGVFDRIVADYAPFAQSAGIGSFTAIPLSGLMGDNVMRPSAAMPWYRGPALLGHLESVSPTAAPPAEAFRMPVQWVNRPDASFRGYAGTIAGGRVRLGDHVTILPSGERTRIERIVAYGGDLDDASAGQAVTLTLAGAVDCARGDVIAAADASIPVAERFGAMLVWMTAEPLVPGRAYRLKMATQTVSASVARVVETIDVNTLSRSVGSRTPGNGLELNGIARCDFVLDRPIPLLPYADDRALGGFILIDRASNATVAAGMVASIDADASGAREDGGAEGSGGRILWLTGGSPAERLGFAHKARQRLGARGRPSAILDPAALREGLNRDLGTGAHDAAEARRRVREVAALISEAGIVVLAPWDASDDAISPGATLDIADADPDAGDWVI